MCLYIATTVNKERGVAYGLMPPSSRLFTGREDDLGKLRQYFDQRDGPSPRRQFLLYGIGGGGKTQIALKFVEECSHLSVSVRDYSVAY